jgi:hypothetical protein
MGSKGPVQAARVRWTFPDPKIPQFSTIQRFLLGSSSMAV